MYVHYVDYYIYTVGIVYSQRKMLEAEREQFEVEKTELHETYDKQQKVHVCY